MDNTISVAVGVDLATVLKTFDPEYPDIVEEIFKEHQSWNWWLAGKYWEQARERIKTQPLEPIPASDEFLREWERMSLICHRELEDALVRYNSDYTYSPLPIEDLRAIWNDANERTSNLYQSRHDRVQFCRSEYCDILTEFLDYIVQCIREESPEYQARVEAERDGMVDGRISDQHEGAGGVHPGCT